MKSALFNGRLVGFNGLQRGLEAIGGMAQKDHPQHRHGVLSGSEVRVGAELVGGLPKAGFYLGNIVECVGGHLVDSCWFISG